ncbi:hypothetical protein BKA62DRAFT_784932, partial [Auriculariales sp. MPI-PUGE-AT-0066]
EQSLKRVQKTQEHHDRRQRRVESIAAQEQREVTAGRERQREKEESALLEDKLKPVHSAAHYSSNAPTACTEGTRTGILSDMQTWALAEYGPIVYWLAGLAGTGKTTIASSLCRQLMAAGITVVSFFISRHSSERNTIYSVITTLAHQLALSSSVSRGIISTVLGKQPPITVRPIAEQTQELLVGPLNAIRAASATAHQQLVIVIDAMDECDDFAASEGRDLLRTLVPALCHRGHNVKLFLTSRYEPELRAMLDRVFDGAQDERETFLLHEVRESYVSADIRTFLTKGFVDIRERFPRVRSTWPPLYQVNELVEMSGKLFVFASTVLLWIGETKASPISRLTEVLATIRDSRPVGLHERSPYGYLDALYLTILRNATSDVDPNSVTNSRLRQVLFMVICGNYPVSLGVVSDVLTLKHHESCALLDSLSAVVHIPSTVERYDYIGIPENMKIKAFHKSFPDFLIDPKRCNDPRFCILHDREEPRLALATVQATQNLRHVKNESVIVTHMQQYWCHNLLNTLRNPNLDSARVLSAIQTMLQAGPI